MARLLLKMETAARCSEKPNNPQGKEIVRLLSTYLGGGYGKKNDLRAGLSFAHNVRCF